MIKNFMDMLLEDYRTECRTLVEKESDKIQQEMDLLGIERKFTHNNKDPEPLMAESLVNLGLEPDMVEKVVFEGEDISVPEQWEIVAGLIYLSIGEDYTTTEELMKVIKDADPNETYSESVMEDDLKSILEAKMRLGL